MYKRQISKRLIYDFHKLNRNITPLIIALNSNFTSTTVNLWRVDVERMNRLRTIGLTPTELPSEISDAMRKLAAGDRDLHLDESGANAEFAAAFNRICAQLNAQRIIDSPPEVSGRETRDALRASCGTAEGAVFLAIITIDQFEGPIQSLDVTTQFLATQSICDDVAALLPAALVLQTSRSSLE